MTPFTLRPATTSTLAFLEALERHRACVAYVWRWIGEGRFRCSSCEVVRGEWPSTEQAFDYTRYARVELDNLESRGGAASVLNPLVPRRSASSRLSR